MTVTLEEILERLDAMQTQVTHLSAGAGSGGTEANLDGGEDISLELRQLLGDDDKIDALGELATRRANEIVRVEMRKKHVVEFVSQVVGGTPERPIGLPIRASELTKLLLSLPEKQSIALEKLLHKIWSNVLDFSEHGVQFADEFSLRRQVPPEYRKMLHEWVELGKSPESFFNANPEAGRAEDYNLADYRKQEEV